MLLLSNIWVLILVLIYECLDFQIVALLLENGADVNSRNYCGQVEGFFNFASLLFKFL